MSFEEKFPDEIILEICRYLTPEEILLSFAQLNSRLNRTISEFIRHVRLKSILSLENYRYLFSMILPSICSSIESFKISNEQIPCLTTIFFDCFSRKFSSNLRRLTLISVNISEIYLFLTRFIVDDSLEELLIECRDVDRRTQAEIFGYQIVQILFYKSNRFRSIEIFGDFSLDFTHVSFQTSDISSNFPLQRLSLNIDSIDFLPNFLKNFLQLEFFRLEIRETTNFYLHTCPTLEKLRRFELHTRISTIELNDLVQMTKFFPNLQTLVLNIDTMDPAFYDGNQLEKFVRRFDHFEYSIGPIPNEQCLTSFCTTFWLEEKRWFTQLFEQIFSDDFEAKLRLASIPYPFPTLSINDVTPANLFPSKFLKNLRTLSLRSISDLKAISFLQMASFIRNLHVSQIYDDDEDYRTDEEEEITDVEVIPMSIDRPTVPLLRYLRHLEINDLLFGDYHFFNGLIRSSPNLSRLSIQKDYLLEYLDESKRHGERTFPNRIEQLDLVIEQFWMSSALNYDLARILREFSQLKILKISWSISPHNQTKLVKEILKIVLKSGQILRCLHIDLIPDELSSPSTKQNELEIIRRYFISLVTNPEVFHLEISSSSLIICY